MIEDCGYIINKLRELNTKDKVSGTSRIQDAGFQLSLDANYRIMRWTVKSLGIYITDFKTTKATLPTTHEVSEELLNIYAQLHMNIKFL